VEDGEWGSQEVEVIPEEEKRIVYSEEEPHGREKYELPKVDGEEDYINANIIRSPFDGHTVELVGTQSPLPIALRNFFRTIWFLKISMVVMLCDPKIDGNDRCFGYNHFSKYLSSPEFDIVFDQSSEQHQVNSNVILKSFTLKHKESGKTRVIQHYSYSNWIDFGRPNLDEDENNLI